MKKLTFIITLIACCCVQASYAGNIEYPVSDIPEKLLLHANAVKRLEEIRIEVINLEKSRYYRKVAYTVLNEAGDAFASFEENYDMLQSITSVEGSLFDATGRKIKSLKQSDIADRPGASQGSFADDTRVKSHNFYYRSYPYTVEYEVEIKMNETMFYPGWIVLENEKLSLQQGSLSISLPEGIEFRYKLFNCAAPQVTTQKSNHIYSWTMNNLPAVQREYASPTWYEATPVVCLAPVQFSIQGYQGNMSTWKDFGKFVYALKHGRDVLPDNIKQTVHELTDGLTNTSQKIDVLYNFMQQNTRYVSIQLGIGGWQPFNAQYVAANRYGDCKALSNYMFSLLREAGIPSFYTLVKAGEGKTFLMEDFPSQQFNHVILSVPLGKDTVWLECTSQSISSGYLSGFTSDRAALLIDSSGGKLVHTPKYSIRDNRQQRHITAVLDEEGNLSADAITRYQGREEDDLSSLINESSKESISKYLKEEINLPHYDLVSYDYKETKSRIPYIHENLKIKAGSYAQVTGKRLFIEPNILTKMPNKLPMDTSRVFDIQLGNEYFSTDTVEIHIPAGYQVESMPQDITLESRFGKCKASIKVDGDKLYYYRSMEQYSGRFPAKSYNEMYEFYNKLYASDRRKVVFVKK